MKKFTEGATNCVAISFAAILCFAAIALLGLIGSGDIEEASHQEAEYCARVQAGTHSDWNGSIDCGEQE